MHTPYSDEPPLGDPGLATHTPSGRVDAGILDGDDYLWVRPLDDPVAPWRRLTDHQRDRHYRFEPYLAREHGWHCDLGSLDLFCADCLRDAIAHDDIHEG